MNGLLPTPNFPLFKLWKTGSKKMLTWLGQLAGPAGRSRSTPFRAPQLRLEHGLKVVRVARTLYGRLGRLGATQSIEPGASAPPFSGGRGPQDWGPPGRGPAAALLAGTTRAWCSWQQCCSQYDPRPRYAFESLGAMHRWHATLWSIPVRHLATSGLVWTSWVHVAPS